MDSYIEDIIKKGDNASELIHSICKETWKFRKEVNVIDSSVGGLTVVRAPEDKKVVVYSGIGDVRECAHDKYAKSLVDVLCEHADFLKVEPVAMTNIIDMSEINIDIIKQAAEGLYRGAKENNVAIINGEIAGLGDRVNVPFNISGTMIGFADQDHRTGISYKGGVKHCIFKHRNMPIFANSDGVGTKIEIAERTGIHTNIYDFLPMVLDDAIKKAGIAKVVLGVMEKNSFRSHRPFDLASELGEQCADKIGFGFVLDCEEIGARIGGYGKAPYNLSGTCISLIDEDILKRLVPKAGEYLVVIRDPNNPTFRSNGITKLRKGLYEMFGERWHNVIFKDRTLGELANAPSTLFYPVFRELLERELASGVYHMSGGAHKGKLARPLAKHGLGAEITDIFEPPDLMRILVSYYFMKPEEAYEVWNMGNEGYVATSRPERAIEIIENYKLEAKVAGKITNVPELKINLPQGGFIVYK